MYNGWKNYQTWNVALWIGNDEPLHRGAVDFIQEYKGRKPYKDFIEFSFFDGCTTQDNVKLISKKLDYRRLNKSMRELID